MKFLLLSSVVLLCFVLHAQQPSFAIRGKVLAKEDSLPLKGAEIKLVGSDNTSEKITADDQGYYSFGSDKVKPNTSYVLSAIAPDVDERARSGSCFVAPYARAKITTRGLTEPKVFIQDFSVQRTWKVIRFPVVMFRKDSILIGKMQIDSLQLLKKIMDDNPSLIIEAKGHNSADEKNLAYQRSKNVADYMITQLGINPERVSPAGIKEVNAPLTDQKESERTVTFSIYSLDNRKE